MKLNLCNLRDGKLIRGQIQTPSVVTLRRTSASYSIRMGPIRHHIPSANFAGAPSLFGNVSRYCVAIAEKESVELSAASPSDRTISGSNGAAARDNGFHTSAAPNIWGDLLNRYRNGPIRDEPIIHHGVVQVVEEIATRPNNIEPAQPIVDSSEPEVEFTRATVVRLPSPIVDQADPSADISQLSESAKMGLARLDILNDRHIHENVQRTLSQHEVFYRGITELTLSSIETILARFGWTIETKILFRCFMGKGDDSIHFGYLHQIIQTAKMIEAKWPLTNIEEQIPPITSRALSMDQICDDLEGLFYVKKFRRVYNCDAVAWIDGRRVGIEIKSINKIELQQLIVELGSDYLAGKYRDGPASLPKSAPNPSLLRTARRIFNELLTIAEYCRSGHLNQIIFELYAQEEPIPELVELIIKIVPNATVAWIDSIHKSILEATILASNISDVPENKAPAAAPISTGAASRADSTEHNTYNQTDDTKVSNRVIEVLGWGFIIDAIGGNPEYATPLCDRFAAYLDDKIKDDLLAGRITNGELQLLFTSFLDIPSRLSRIRSALLNTLHQREGGSLFGESYVDAGAIISIYMGRIPQYKIIEMDDLLDIDVEHVSLAAAFNDWFQNDPSVTIFRAARAMKDNIWAPYLSSLIGKWKILNIRYNFVGELNSSTNRTTFGIIISILEGMIASLKVHDGLAAEDVRRDLQTMLKRLPSSHANNTTFKFRSKDGATFIELARRYVALMKYITKHLRKRPQD